ncbi:uncharacterized protein LOC127666973 isoform X4 [Apodemus sylvaticus]|uniref:uncharacterized protein LOC127666973 isoform X4 n=1 Tax=Apodemus sylvaticus TaxID=10129 RepID=UPI002243E2B6|nr:uncharacterized protein LOC127666973 isoform X4 [Apodemus sylvaticus]
MVMASSRPSIFSFSLYFSLFLLLLLYNKALKLWAASSYQNPPCRSNLSVSSSQKGPKEQRTKAQPGFLYRYTGARHPYTVTLIFPQRCCRQRESSPLATADVGWSLAAKRG